MCYKSEPEGKYIYINEGALSAFNYNEAAGAADGEAPVPPCIQQTSAGAVQVAIELDDKVQRRAVISISADEVKVAVQNPAHIASDELVEFMVEPPPRCMLDPRWIEKAPPPPPGFQSLISEKDINIIFQTSFST